MSRTSLLRLLSGLLLPWSLSAQEKPAALPADAAQSVREYQKARQEGLVKLNRALIEKLEGAKKRRMQANDLEAANAIEKEIAGLRSEIAALQGAAPPPAGAAEAPGKDTARLQKLVSNSYWKGAHDVWYFRADGTGAKVYQDTVHDMKWTMEAGGLVRAVGGGSDVYFEFKTEKRALRWSAGRENPEKQPMEREPDGIDPGAKKQEAKP